MIWAKRFISSHGCPNERKSAGSERGEEFYGSARSQSQPARRGAPYDPGLMAELVPRPGVESHEPVVNARELLAYAFREYELAGGTK